MQLFFNEKWLLKSYFFPIYRQVDGTAPTFVTKPTIRQDADGTTLIFHCSIFADPKPVVTWFHNGDKIQDNKKFQVSFFWKKTPILDIVIQFPNLITLKVRSLDSQSLLLKWIAYIWDTRTRYFWHCIRISHTYWIKVR